MKEMKKIIAFLVTACMLSTMVAFATDTDSVQEVTDTVYQADVTKLSALGLWTLSDDEGAEKQVTRGEYAKLMVTMIGMKDQPVNTPAIFRDVTAENPNYSAISILHSLKVISGEYGSLFRPDDAITYNEAMKLLMSILGYNLYADEIGGYPVGYMMAAREQGLYLGNVSGSDQLIRGNVATLLVSSLDVPLLKKHTIGKTTIFNKSDNVTVLSEYFSIHKSMAVIKAVGPTRINEGVRLMEGIVDLDGVIFNAGNTNAVDYIGYRVYGYFKEDRNAPRNTLIFIEPLNNTVYEFNNKEIYSYDPITGRLTYFTNVDEGKKSYITIKDNIIFNNVRTINYNRNDFETADKIKAIDNNNDGVYDAVFIENEEIFMVKSVNSSDMKIYDNYKADGILDIESDGMTKVVTIADRYGNPADITSITFGSVLNVVRSKPDANNSMTTSIVLTNQSFTGKITEIIEKPSKEIVNDDGSTSIIKDYEYIIDDTKYELAKNKDSIAELNTIKVGNTYKFYLDKNNYIAGFDTTGSSSEQYGFLVKAAFENELDTQPTVRIYTTGRTFLDTKLANNVVINDSTKKLNRDETMAKLRNGKAPVMVPDGNGSQKESSIIGLGIRYKLNANNEISSIIVANPPAPGVTDENYEYGTQKMNQFPLDSNPMYLRDVGLFDGRVRINSNTVVIVVPVKDQDSYYDDIDKFGIGNMDTFKSFAGVDRNMVRFYDLNKERTAGLVIYHAKKPGGTVIDRNTRITVVTKISTILNEKGEPSLKLYGLQGGKEISVNVAPEVNFKRIYDYVQNGEAIRYTQTVERGDIIRYAINAAGELDDYEKVFDLNDQDNPNYIKRFSYTGYDNPTAVTDDDNVSGSVTDSAMKGMHCMISITEKFPVIDKGVETDRRFHMVHHGSNQYYFYAVQFKLIYATLMDKIGDTITYKIGPSVDMANGKMEIASLSRFSITVIDTAQDLIYASNESELTPAKVVNNDESKATKMIMYLAGGIPRDIIIVK